MARRRLRRFRRAVARARRFIRPGRIGHTRKGVAEMIGDSRVGVRFFKLLAKKRADRNIARVKGERGRGTGPGVLNHWPFPLRHGMHHPTLPRDTYIGDMTLEQFKTMSGPGGHPSTLYEDNTLLATGRKVHPIWEPKTEECNDLAFWVEAVADATSKGLIPWGWALPKYHHILPVMKRAGVKRVIRLRG